MFEARAAEARAVDLPTRRWPPRLVVPNDEWKRAYPALAESVAISLTLEQAVAELGDWVEAIEQAG